MTQLSTTHDAPRTSTQALAALADLVRTCSAIPDPSLVAIALQMRHEPQVST